MSNEKQTVLKAGRIDKILSDTLDISRNQIEKLIKEGLVSVNGRTVRKTSFKVEEGDEIAYVFKKAEKREPVEVDFDVEVLYEDEYLLVINKPSGLVVHPAPSVKEPTLVDWLVQKGISLSTISGEERHGIVHRIDKETTGALVVAKDNRVHMKLSEQLQEKSMGRYYLALIDHPLKDDVTVDKPIGRNPKNRLKMDVVPHGKEAKTAFKKLLASQYDIELVSAKLFTGRTHQIRVHLNTLGRHILGDDLYGFKSKRDKIPRVYLHAYLLYLTHPVTGKQMEFVAPLFDDMQTYLTKYFEEDEIEKKLDPKCLKEGFQVLGV
ncbi:RluA family pseudouridine synthase [Sulfurovum sp. ST-21]|uniref:Pseudouridine synthase n=1 Tax=Sulfurovum indicum TaxID=2779528 RepID=A0A7M1S515_9BACT|nr:RluA family pseudouridine synthase [Sulfurovum indicum]QOR62507.1 RluA family pseudouridine synthase [Sulfurovum indicum]